MMIHIVAFIRLASEMKNILQHLPDQVQRVSKQLLLVFTSHQRSELQRAAATSGAPTDNVLEIEMSHSDMDEEEFADIISSPALQRGRGEQG